MNEEETKQKIKELWRELKYPFHLLDQSIVSSWEKEYDTTLDPTNLPQFFIDRYNKPIKFIETFCKNKFCKTLPKFNSKINIVLTNL